jgi:hypothetical protein
MRVTDGASRGRWDRHASRSVELARRVAAEASAGSITELSLSGPQR